MYLLVLQFEVVLPQFSLNIPFQLNVEFSGLLKLGIAICGYNAIQ